MGEATKVVMVHPEDVNVADAKALAARHGATVLANKFIRRGEFLLTTQDVLGFPTALAPTQPGAPPAPRQRTRGRPMALSNADREEADDCLNAAYDALAGVVDIAHESGDLLLETAANAVQDGIETLRRTIA